jgi:hypothetical protein
VFTLQKAKVAKGRSLFRIIIVLLMVTCSLLAMVVLAGAYDRAEMVVSMSALAGVFAVWYFGRKVLKAARPRQFYKLDISPETIRLSIEDDSGTLTELYTSENNGLTPHQSFMTRVAHTFLAPLNVYFLDSAGRKLWVPLFMDDVDDALSVFEIMRSGKQATYRLSIEHGQLNAFREFAPEAKYDGKFVDVESGLW